MVREVTKNPTVTLWKCENLPEGQPSLLHSTNQAFMVEWHMTPHLEFAKSHLKDSQTMRNKILWSDET